MLGFLLILFLAYMGLETAPCLKTWYIYIWTALQFIKEYQKLVENIWPSTSHPQETGVVLFRVTIYSYISIEQ